MPLDSFGGLPVPELEGIYFGMKNGSQTVRCLVSREALDDWAGSGEDPEEVFASNRSYIEDLASKNFDAGKIRDGVVIITSRDMNPGLFI